MAEGREDSLSLKDVFEKGLTLHKHIQNDDEPSSSKKVQANIQTAADHFTKATEMVNSLELFSTNEELEEIPTGELRYLLLPAFLGDLCLRKMVDDQLTLVNNAQIYFTDFLKRAKDYGLTSEDVPKYTEDSNSASNERSSRNPSLEQMADSRHAKIRRYKEQKEQERRMKELENMLSGVVIDEEIQREHSLVLLKTWVNKALEQLASIQDEIQILEHMNKMKKGNLEKSGTEKQLTRKPIKPILITRETLKSKVFGAGYSSIPTMTQEECLEKEIREGKIVLEYDQHKKKQHEDIDKKTGEDSESEDDDEDPEKLRKAREWDDWKDDHRRGWGNRENMG